MDALGEVGGEDEEGPDGALEGEEEEWFWLLERE